MIRRSEDAYAKLRYAILEGEIQPGERLAEQNLSQALGMSRIPIREALIRLEAEGLIHRIAGGGFHAHEFTIEEIEEATELRAALESLAVKLACRRGFQDSRIVEMEHVLDRIDKAHQQNDFREACRLDLEFHQRLIALAGSRRLVTTVRGAHLQVFAWHGLRPDLLQARVHITAQHHREILRLLRDRDATAAANMVTEHILSGRDERARAALVEQTAGRRPSMKSIGELLGSKSVRKHSLARSRSRAKK